MTKQISVPLFFVSALSTFLNSCVVPLSQQAVNVRETTEDLVVDCRFISLIKPNSLFGIGQENIRNELRARAAELGATDIAYKRTSSDSIRGANIFNCMDRDF